jgi:hypothetical protein
MARLAVAIRATVAPTCLLAVALALQLRGGFELAVELVAASDPAGGA